MLTLFKKWFAARCPICDNKLKAAGNAEYSTKSCPQGHYREENHFSLGVTITYEGLN